MASSSYSSSSSCNYEVFLSFRGDDTRGTFTSHLFYGLRQRKVRTFFDEDLKRGNEISPALLNAIEASKISIIIFSQDYASSKWCLDELVKILECKKLNGQIVMPVFYRVYPSDVRKQSGRFGKAFAEHAISFKKTPEKVRKWRDALTEASHLAGHESIKFRLEAELVDAIIKDVLKKLEDTIVSADSDGLVGINSQIELVKSLLCIGLQDFRIVGIWGMGGIGKTTLAEVIFEQYYRDFEGKCFMANVRKKTQQEGGLEHLQKQVFSYLLDENLEKEGPNIPYYTKERLQRTKVFIVLDDVDKLEQLEVLVGGLKGLSLGSRIIVTTRDRSVLDNYGVEYIYKVENLNNNEALELFCNNAFGRNSCPQDLIMLAERVLDYAKGNPLALKVLGSSLKGRTIPYWENALDNLKQISNPRIYDVLKICYDKLNPKLKNIFLDIACFFRGYDKDHVISIVDDRSLMHYGLNVLVDKSLLTISCNKLEMHDLLQEMGQEIIHQESEDEPGKRSRLWYHEDICHVLKENKGTNSIKGIFLDLSKIRDINLDSRAFANMSNLRMLKVYLPEQFGFPDIFSKLHLYQGLEYLSHELRYLYWHGYPLSTLPMNFKPENLIELSLPCSKVEQLWEGKKEAFKLKYIDLQYSQRLTKFPDPLQIPNLERINLLNCVKLPSIPSSIQNFNNLGILCLKHCTSLSYFLGNIYFKSPITIDFSFTDLTEFPSISGKVTELTLVGTGIQEVPPSIESLTDLEKLDLTFSRLQILSTSICKLKSLRELTLNYCPIKSFPEILEKMECLEYIGLHATSIEELPSSIENVEGLKILSLMDCSKLKSLPDNLGNLKSLKFIYGKRSAICQLPSSITHLKQLEQLSLSGCKGLVVPSLSGLSSLKNLELDDCGIMEIPEDIGCLSSLERLNLQGNNFETLPASIKQLFKLRELILRNCKMLQSLPELPLCPFRLEATNCKMLQCLPELPSHLEELDSSVLENLCQCYFDNKDAMRMELNFSNCPKLYYFFSEIWIHSMAIASLRQFYEKEIPVPYGVTICLPGSQIALRFGNRNLGSSTQIKQSELCCDRNFIGFGIRFVVRDIADEDYAVICKYRFKTETFSKTSHADRHFVFENRLVDKCKSPDQRRMYLVFEPCSIVGLSDGVSFDFSIESPLKSRERQPKLECCEVCPIYAHPSKTKPNSFTVNMLPPSKDKGRKLPKEFQDEASTSSTTTEVEVPADLTRRRSTFLSDKLHNEFQDEAIMSATATEVEVSTDLTRRKSTFLSNKLCFFQCLVCRAKES